MVENGKPEYVQLGPAWLSERYLEEVLQRNKQDAGLRVIDVIMQQATAPGENYASIMTRIKVEFLRSNAKQSETEYYIVKTTHENDPEIAKILAGYHVTETEMFMYEQVLPQLSELLQEINDDDKLFARTVHVDYEHEAIIFEDLAVSNYVMADRLVGMDLAHAQLALRKLAKMHAAAAVLNERKPHMLTKLNHGIFNRHTSGLSPIFENLMGEAAVFAGECAELGNEYRDKLLKLQKRVIEYTNRVNDPQPENFNTLMHGDFWINNVMLRYGAQRQPLDMLLVDFQYCCWCSPAVDLHYFFNTSLQTELRFKQQDVLVQYYHQVLVKTLRALNFGGYVPTLRQLVLQLEAGRFAAVTYSLTSQVIMLSEKHDDADLKALLYDDERGRNFRKWVYSNKKVQNILKHLLPEFNRCGLLDVDD